MRIDDFFLGNLKSGVIGVFTPGVGPFSTKLLQYICPEIFIGVDKGLILGCQPDLLEFENAWEGVVEKSGEWWEKLFLSGEELPCCWTDPGYRGGERQY